MEGQVTIYKYVLGEAQKRSKFLKAMDSRSDTILEHVVKVLLYRKYRQHDVNGWIKTISRSFDYIGSFEVKSSVSEHDYVENLFGAFPISVSDARGILGNPALDFEQQGYTDLNEQVFYDTAPVLFSLSNSLIENVIPVLMSKHHDKGYEFYRSIVVKCFNDNKVLVD